MQALTGITNQSGQPLLDIEVYILQIHRPGKFAADDLVLDLGHAAAYVAQVRGADDAARFQHLSMGQRPLDIEQAQAPVELDRSRVTLYQFGHWFVETAGPTFFILHHYRLLSRIYG